MCWLELDLPPSTNLKEIRDGVLLQIAIPRKSGDGEAYSALGRIKAIKHVSNSSLKIGILQIDFTHPIQREERQEIPEKNGLSSFPDRLSFRVKFDD